MEQPKLYIPISLPSLDHAALILAQEGFLRISSAEDADLLLSDNFFDLNADEKRVRILRGKAESLRVRSVYDLD